MPVSTSGAIYTYKVYWANDLVGMCTGGSVEEREGGREREERSRKPPISRKGIPTPGTPNRVFKFHRE